jgi:hypothetical protein
MLNDCDWSSVVLPQGSYIFDFSQRIVNRMLALQVQYAILF